MNRILLSACLLCMIALMLSPLPAMAAPAINCHCFTDRSFDPGHPAAADPYFLATVQNSFFAALFDIEKKTIVMKKQTGTSADDLWVAYGVGSKAGVSPEALLEAKQSGEDWRKVITSRGVGIKSLGARFSAALTANAPTARLAEAMVDDLLVRLGILGESDVAALRAAGATTQEAIIAALIAKKTGQPAKQPYMQVKAGSKTWGALLRATRIESTHIQAEVAALLSQRH